MKLGPGIIYSFYVYNMDHMTKIRQHPWTEPYNAY